jgi:hypothetical protein
MNIEIRGLFSPPNHSLHVEYLNSSYGYRENKHEDNPLKRMRIYVVHMMERLELHLNIHVLLSGS